MKTALQTYDRHKKRIALLGVIALLLLLTSTGLAQVPPNGEHAYGGTADGTHTGSQSGTHSGTESGTFEGSIDNGLMLADQIMSSHSSVILHSFSDDDLIWATDTFGPRPDDVWGRESTGGYLHVEWWVSAGFQGGGTSVAEYDLQVNGVLIHNHPQATCDSSTVAVGSDGSATNPSRGHGYAKMICMIPDPLGTVAFDAVNQNSSQINNLQSGLKVTTLSSFVDGTGELPITGNVSGSYTGSTSGTYSGSSSGTYSGEERGEIEQINATASMNETQINNLTTENLRFTNIFGSIQVEELGFWIPILFWLIVMLSAWRKMWILTGTVAMAGFLVELLPEEHKVWGRTGALLLLIASIAVEFFAEKMRLKRESERGGVV